MIFWSSVRYDEYRNHEIMEFARKIRAVKIGIANGFEPYSVICKVEGRAKSSMGIPEKCEEIGSSSQSGSCALYLFTFSSL